MLGPAVTASSPGHRWCATCSTAEGT